MSAVAPPERRPSFFTVVSDMVDAVVLEPVREGALRLRGTPRMVRRAAVAGLVLLAVVTVSLLAADVWRSGRLIVVSTSPQPTLLPEAVFPLTLVALFVAWVLIVWGASFASPIVRVAVAAFFLLVNVSISRVPVLPFGRSWWLNHGSTVAHVGYIAVPIALVVSSVGRVVPRLNAILRMAVLAVTVAGCAALFGGMLAVHVAAVDAGQPSQLPTTLQLAITGITNLTVPLVIAGAAAVVDFSYSVAVAASLPPRALAGRVTKVVMTVFIAVVAVLQLHDHWSEFAALAEHRPLNLLRSAGAVVLFVLFAFLLSRMDRSSSAESRMRVASGAAVLLALPTVVLVLKALLGLFFTFEIKWSAAAEAFGSTRGTHRIITWGGALVWGATLLIAVVVLLARRRGGRAAGAAAGFAIVAAWGLSTSILDGFSRNPGLSVAFISTLVGIGAAVIAIARFQRITVAMSVNLAALVLFAWLVSRKGEIVSTIGDALAAPGAVLIVFAIVYGVVADCAYTHGDTKALPRTARVLLFIGFLLVSSTLANWVEVTHGRDVSVVAQSQGFLVLALPLAAWYAMSERFEHERT